MKVKWEQFAQRRRINLEMFKSMSYVDYCSWCSFRRVEPVSQESYEGVQKLVEQVPVPTKEIPAAVTTVTTHEFNEAQLKKLKKQALLKLCEEHSLNIDAKSTKKELIDLLLSLNK